MNRPAVLRHIDQHVARARVTPYRLRAPDAARLLDYVQELEGKRRTAGDVCGPYVPPPPLVTFDCLDAMGGSGSGSTLPPCGECGLAGGHHLMHCASQHQRA